MNEENEVILMRQAMEVATARGRDPALNPIGSLIELRGEVLAAERNHVAEQRDPTAHAEIAAIRSACYRLGRPDLRGATLYSTLQPCGMCTMAAIWAKVSRIIYGAGRPDVHRMYFEDRHIDTLEFVADAYRTDISIKGGVLRDECAQFYYRPHDNPPAKLQGNV
jgi:tRNA(adenine34) deaminase